MLEGVLFPNLYPKNKLRSRSKVFYLNDPF